MKTRNSFHFIFGISVGKIQKDNLYDVLCGKFSTFRCLSSVGIKVHFFISHSRNYAKWKHQITFCIVRMKNDQSFSPTKFSSVTFSRSTFYVNIFFLCNIFRIQRHYFVFFIFREKVLTTVYVLKFFKQCIIRPSKI